MINIYSTGKNTKLEEEIDFGLVICGDDVELVHKLDQAAERGDIRKIQVKVDSLFFFTIIIIFNLLFCRFESTGYSCGACNPQSSVPGQVVTSCWMLLSRIKSTYSDGPS